MDRRKFLRSSALGACALGANLEGLFAEKPSVATANAPNVVIIHADDLGWRDLGCMKSPVYETPHIDRLAESGMLFTSAYSAAAICTPSRACLLTGSQPPRHGIYTVNKNRGKKEQWSVIPTKNRAYLEKDYPTIGHCLSEAGIANGAIGKWHVYPKSPKEHGFQVGELGGYLGLPINYFAPFKLGFLPKDAPEGAYLPEYLRREGVQFLHEHHKEKFFLYFSTYLPHDEIRNKGEEPEGEGIFRLAAPERVVEKYRKKIAHLDKTGIDLEGHRDPVYAAMIEETDRSVGAIVDAIENLKLREKTLLLFISDNGGLTKYTSQEPLRGEKTSLYEGGIRVPMIASQPGKIEEGVRSDVPVSGIDFYPTISKLMGLKAFDSEKVDGSDLGDLLYKCKTLGERNLFWTFPCYVKPNESDKSPRSVIRRGDWKLHHLYENNQYELYNLREDLGETENLVETHVGKLEEMKKELQNCYRRFGAPSHLEKNPDYNADSVVRELKQNPKAKISTAAFYKSKGLSSQG